MDESEHHLSRAARRRREAAARARTSRDRAARERLVDASLVVGVRAVFARSTKEANVFASRITSRWFCALVDAGLTPVDAKAEIARRLGNSEQ